MLAATVTNREALQFPYLASPKLDGIRCLVLDGKVVSRNLKPIRNAHIQACLRGLPDLDGELIVGSPTASDAFNQTTRGVMSGGGTPDFKFHVFDTLEKPDSPFFARLKRIPEHLLIVPVPHVTILTPVGLLEYESEVLRAGYEGVMLRHALSTYKFGRATPNENTMWKLKQFTDGEVRITSVIEGVINNNEATMDALGRTVRSKHQENMVPNGRVGTIIGTDLATGAHMELSPGKMNHAERMYYFRNPYQIIGRVAKYKAFPYGMVNTARFATFQGFRDASDMLEK